MMSSYLLTYLLKYGAEPYLRSCQLCSHSVTSQDFKEPEGSSPCSQEPSTGPYPQPVRSSPYHPILFFYYYYLVYEAIGTAATPGLLCQPRVLVKMIVEKQLECRLAGETEVLGANLPQRHLCPSQNPTWPDPDLNRGRRGGKSATNRLSYGAAYHPILSL
jgi:hypothetical protein